MGICLCCPENGHGSCGALYLQRLRFLLGCLSLLPVIAFQRNTQNSSDGGNILKAGSIAGFFLFCGISLQQIGLVYTTAGKAGFITGLYVIFVPIIGLILKETRTSAGTWAGALLACAGMYLLSVTKDMKIGFGDILVLFSAVCFAFHLIIIGRLCNRFDTAKLSLIQCIVCTGLSLGVAGIFESFVLSDILKVSIPLLYGGVLSVGVAYSLQIYGQKNSPPSHAAIIFSLESVFAAIGGWLILDEILSGRAILGCAMMLAGMLMSQLSKTEPGLP